MSSFTGTHWFRVSFICFLWLLLILLVHPAGEFPLNDDWTYSKSVYLLSEKGKLDLGQVPAMTLMTHLLWGTLFCKIAGFSFTVLRISTIIMGMAGIIATYIFLRESTPGKRLELWGTALLAFNPLFFSLSTTFMTDITFYTFTVISLIFYCRALSGGAWKNIITGTLFAFAATFTRQPGVLIPLAFAAAWLARRRTARDLAPALLPAFIVIASLAIWTKWMDAHHRLPGSYAHASALIDNIKPQVLFKNLFHRGGYILLYCGLFIFPVLLLLFPRIPPAVSKRKKIIAACITLLFALPLLRAWSGFPVDNIINLHSLGPQTLKDVSSGHNVVQLLPQPVWDIVRSAGVAGGLILVFYLLLNLLSIRSSNVIKDPAAIFFILYGSFLILCPSFFDRYFLPFIPLLPVLLFPFAGEAGLHPVRKIAAGASIAFIAFFSFAGTHDYHAWNNARWQALHFLMDEKGISPKDIDGGYEFNGWYETGPMNPDDQEKSWWFVHNDEYLVSFGPYEGYEEVKRFPFQSILPSGKNIFVLHKEPK